MFHIIRGLNPLWRDMAATIPARHATHFLVNLMHRNSLVLKVSRSFLAYHTYLIFELSGIKIIQNNFWKLGAFTVNCCSYFPPMGLLLVLSGHLPNRLKEDWKWIKQNGGRIVDKWCSSKYSSKRGLLTLFWKKDRIDWELLYHCIKWK